MKRFAPIVLLLILVGGPSADAAPTAVASPARYIPADGWSGDWQADFYENWFGNQLRAMNEPHLSGSGNRRYFRQRFRMLVVPNYDPAFAVRVDEGQTGKAVARFVILDGAGGYSPGRIAEEASFVLNSAQKKRLAEAIRAAALDSAPRELKPQAEDGSMVICIHATHYVFELVDEGGASIVRRDCNLAGGLRDLALEAEALRRVVDPDAPRMRAPKRRNP